MSSEHALIKQLFAPLASGFTGSMNLSDDAALISPPAGHELVVTKDVLVAGVHFFGHEDAALIAQKALRTNLSDLAAKGANPLAYFLGVMLPKDTDKAWLARFAEGLQKDQQEFGIHLAGGDTVATPGPLSISITALGVVSVGGALLRSGAKVGDVLFVSGTLGDSALGLISIKQQRGDAYLEQRYLLPEPRLALGASLRGVASACMDISDGLVQDLGHICAASSVGAEINAASIPLSAVAQKNPDALNAALSGGDDYELLFAVPQEKLSYVPAGCTQIGRITAGEGVRVMGADGKQMPLPKAGYSHF